MSSILKALKKLEYEKTARKPDSFKIDAEILRGGAAPRSFFTAGASLAAIALFLCGVGATYVFMKRHEAPVVSQAAQTSTTEAKVGPPAAVGLPHEPEDKGATAPPALMSPRENPEAGASGRSQRNMPVPQQIRPEKPAEGVAPRVVLPEPKPAIPSPVAPPAVVTPSLPPVLRVHGIAFQDGSFNGVAVVNGVAVSKGSVIEGARVEEIQKDRVTFSRGGEMFEVMLDKSN